MKEYQNYFVILYSIFPVLKHHRGFEVPQGGMQFDVEYTIKGDTVNDYKTCILCPTFLR